MEQVSSASSFKHNSKAGTMKNKKHISGMTLIELVVTLVISSFLVIIAGTLFVFTFKSWFTGESQIGKLQDLRYCKMKMEYELRKASYIDLSVNNITFRTDDSVLNKSFEIRTSSIVFVNIDRSEEVILNNINSDQTRFLPVGTYVVYVEIVLNNGERRTFNINCRNLP